MSESFRRFFVLGPVAALALLVPGVAQAAPEYCSAGASPTVTEGQTPNLSVDNVTLGGLDADDCFGIASGNNDLDDVNALNFGTWESDGEMKAEDSNSFEDTLSYLGLDWTLTADGNQQSGTWTINIEDPAPASLPVTADLLVVLKGATSWAAYFFEDYIFNAEGDTDGTYQIVFLNNGGQIPGLSHLSLYIRGESTPPDDPGGEEFPDVPEPTALLLLGTGLAVTASKLRRRFLN
jgi:hypothetical protein